MSLFKALIYEYKAIFTNKVVLLVVFVGSMVYGILYPMPYLNDIVTKQTLLIVDEDNSFLSKELIFLVSATPQIELVSEVDSLQSAEQLIENFEANGVLFIPQGFESNAQMGVGSIVSYMGNASYFLIYGAIVEGIHNAIDSLSTRLYREKNINALSPAIISYEAIPLYNPSLGYINYALAAVLVFILHQTLIGGSAIVSAYQNRIFTQNAKEIRALREQIAQNGGIENHNPFTTKMPYYFALFPLKKILCARILAFCSIYIMWFLLYFGVLFPLFGVSIHASASDFWCFGLVFIFACAGCGTLLGSCLNDESLPTQVVFISSMPLVFIMGFIWPSELLPSFLRELAYVIPAFHGIRGFISLNQMGAEFANIMPHFFTLGFLFVLSITISFFILHKKQERNEMNWEEILHFLSQITLHKKIFAIITHFTKKRGARNAK